MKDKRYSSLIVNILSGHVNFSLKTSRIFKVTLSHVFQLILVSKVLLFYNICNYNIYLVLLIIIYYYITII